VNEALSAKETAIADLESQVSETKSSLESALADIQEKQTKLEELELAKTTAEQQLEEIQAKLQTIEGERDADDSVALLESVKAEVCQFVAPHAVWVLIGCQWHLVARVEAAPSVRASICKNPSITDNLPGIRDHLYQVRIRGPPCV